MEKENQGKNKFWRPNTSEAKKQEYARNANILNRIINIETKGYAPLYLTKAYALDRHEEILAFFKQWCDDYKKGKTYELPTVTKIARHCKAGRLTVHRVIEPYYKKYLEFNTISAEDYKQIWTGELLDE